MPIEAWFSPQTLVMLFIASAGAVGTFSATKTRLDALKIELDEYKKRAEGLITRQELDLRFQVVTVQMEGLRNSIVAISDYQKQQLELTQRILQKLP